MNVEISERKMAMAPLNVLPEEYNALNSALDPIDYDETELKFELIKSRVIQEEQHIALRTKSAREKSETAALLTTRQDNSSCNRGYQRRSSHYYNFCKRTGRTEYRCWAKFRYLNPSRNNRPSSNPALIATESDEDRVFCLMAKYENSNEPKNSNKWFVDPGCSNHKTFYKSIFFSYTIANTSSIELGNSGTVKVLGPGTVKIPISVHDKRVKCMLRNVLHVPELSYQQLSVPTLDKSGLRISFHSKRFWISNGPKLFATATMTGNLYKLDIQSDSETALLASTAEHWHLRLAQIQPWSILEMGKSKTVQGLEVSSSDKHGRTYSSCVLGKANRSPIPKQSLSRSTQFLELVHSDVNGLLEVQSTGGSRDFVTSIDNFSKWNSIINMRNKPGTFGQFKIFRAQAEKHTGATLKSFYVIKRSTQSAEELKIIRIDNRREYLSNEFKSYLKEHGI